MKKIITKPVGILLALLMTFSLFSMLSFTTFAVMDGTLGDNLTWTLDDGLLTISGTGDMPDYDTSAINQSPFAINPTIRKLVISEGVTGIGDYAFYSCKNLADVTIPDSVTSIGYCAFYNTACYNNSSIDGDAYIGNHLIKVYDGMLGEYEIKDGTVSIAGMAFYNCSGLTGVTIPGSVKEIGQDAFYGCSSLEEVTFKGTEAKWNNVTIGSGNSCLTGASITCTGDTGDQNSNQLGDNLTWTLDNGVLTISGTGDMPDYDGFSGDPFYSNGNIKAVVINSGVTRIGDSAFEGCSKLASVTIPDSVTSIGSLAFAFCSGLTSITIPDSVTSIGGYAFCNTACYNNSLIDGVVYIGNFLIRADGSEISGEYEIKAGTVHIADEAFENCDGLTSVTLPDGVKTIGFRAFALCDNLTSVTIPDSLTEIESFAFLFCNAIKDVYYSGTEAEWEAVAIGSGNDVLGSATIHYNSLGPEETTTETTTETNTETTTEPTTEPTTQPSEEPTTEPVTEPASEASDDENACKWCGETHTGFWGRIVGFFHSILYFFAHLFGRK